MMHTLTTDPTHAADLDTVALGARPHTVPPVGKSGPLIIVMRSSIVASG